MEQLPNWHRTNLYTFRNPRHRYNPVLENEENGIYLYSIPDRIKLLFDVKIKLPTILFGYDALHYLKQAFLVNNDYVYLNNVNLRTEVPKVFIWYIAEALHLDLYKQDDRDIINEFLLRNSYGGIQELINPASLLPQYSYNYKVNILMNTPDRASFDKNIKGMVVDNTTISFNFSFEFWTHSNYILRINEKVTQKQYPQDLMNEIPTMKFNIFPEVHYIKTTLEDEKKLIIKKDFITDVNKKIDTIEIYKVLSKELSDVINECKNNKFNLNKLFKIKVFRNNIEIDNMELNMNWKDLILTINNPLNNTQYTLLIYGDLYNLNLIDKYIQDDTKDEIKLLNI